MESPHSNAGAYLAFPNLSRIAELLVNKLVVGSFDCRRLTTESGNHNLLLTVHRSTNQVLTAPHNQVNRWFCAMEAIEVVQKPFVAASAISSSPITVGRILKGPVYVLQSY